jgi:hypothetical protein
MLKSELIELLEDFLKSEEEYVDVLEHEIDYEDVEQFLLPTLKELPDYVFLYGNTYILKDVLGANQKSEYLTELNAKNVSQKVIEYFVDTFEFNERDIPEYKYVLEGYDLVYLV